MPPTKNPKQSLSFMKPSSPVQVHLVLMGNAGKLFMVDDMKLPWIAVDNLEEGKFADQVFEAFANKYQSHLGGVAPFFVEDTLDGHVIVVALAALRGDSCAPDGPDCVGWESLFCLNGGPSGGVYHRAIGEIVSAALFGVSL